MQATQYHNSGSRDGSKAGQIKRKRHDKFQALEGNLNNNNAMVLLCSLSRKKLQNLKICSHQVAEGIRLCVFWSGVSKRR